MAKRINYGKTFGPFYDLYRKFYKELLEHGESMEDIPEMFFKYFTNTFAQSLDDVTAVSLFLKDLKKELLHLYIKDSALIPFFKSIEIKDLDGIKQYLIDNGNVVQVNTTNEIEGVTPGVSFGICLHPSFEKQGFVISYTLLIKTNEIRIFVNHGSAQYHISSTEIDDKKSIVYTDNEMNQITKLAVNLIAYICCFPDCLVDGTPRDVKTENNKYLVTSDKVLDIKDDVVTGLVNPHFRRGYFKRLSSDFYKNKKGQIIFVHETMVNGVAKTLEI